jgi:hypothetical protein
LTAAEVAKFVGVHDRADDVHGAVGDVEADNVDQAASGVEALSTWLSM